MNIGSIEITRHRQSIAKGVAAGLIAGFVATWVKSRFQSTWTDVQSAAEPDDEKRNSESAEESTTVKTAKAVSEKVFHHELTDKEKPLAGSAVDMAFGTISGGIYGALAEKQPAVTAGGGAAFGSALWLAADELGTAATGLAKPPNRYPASTHAYSLAGHLVYGFTCEIVRRATRMIMR